MTDSPRDVMAAWDAWIVGTFLARRRDPQRYELSRCTVTFEPDWWQRLDATLIDVAERADALSVQRVSSDAAALGALRSASVEKLVRRYLDTGTSAARGEDDDLAEEDEDEEGEDGAASGDDVLVAVGGDGEATPGDGPAGEPERGLGQMGHRIASALAHRAGMSSREELVPIDVELPDALLEEFDSGLSSFIEGLLDEGEEWGDDAFAQIRSSVVQALMAEWIEHRGEVLGAG